MISAPARRRIALAPFLLAALSAAGAPSPRSNVEPTAPPAAGSPWVEPALGMRFRYAPAGRSPRASGAG